MPIKCPGAPQKIAYLTADRLRAPARCNPRPAIFLHAPMVFGVPFFARELVKVVARYGVNAQYQQNLVAVDGAAKTATFEAVGGDNKGKRITLTFDMLHVSPPQSPHDAIAKSPLANAAGSSRSIRTRCSTSDTRMFSLGDAASSPNSKTAAAVRKQSPIVVRNILHLIAGRPVGEATAAMPLARSRPPTGKCSWRNSSMAAKSRRRCRSIRRRSTGSAG